jgi:ankyrin repeat protein
LQSAALLGKAAVVKKLVELGADRILQNEFGETPLDVAKIGNRGESASLLK